MGREGLKVNHKRVWRVYREAGLCVKRRKRKRLVRVGPPAVVVTAGNEQWALDFAADAIATGRPIRILSVIDTYTRECLALEVDTSFASRRVTRVLEQIIRWRGLPQSIRCDNGAELTSRHFIAWCVERRINRVHIQPGRPMQMGTSRASQANCAMSVSTRVGFATCSMPGGRSALGAVSTIASGHTRA